MANFYNDLNRDIQNPSQGWVYASDQYKIYQIEPSVAPDSRAKFDRVGHSIMRSVNPDWFCFKSAFGLMQMVVGNTRWDAESLKAVLERECFQATAGDVTYTVTESTGHWTVGSSLLTFEGSASELIVDNNYSHWRDKTFPADDPDGFYSAGENFVQEADGYAEPYRYMWSNRTQATRPSETAASWLDPHEQVLNESASLATNYNLGNYFDGTNRYNEFPLDLAITNGSNLRLYHFDLDEIDTDDWNMITGASTSDPVVDANLYDRGTFLDHMIGTLNPMAYCFGRDNGDATEEGVQNRLFAFIENDKFGPGGIFGLSQLMSNIGGDFDGDEESNPQQNDAGLVIAPVSFVQYDTE